MQKLVNGTKVYQLGSPPERVLLNLPCVMHSVRALESPLMTEAALNWGFAPSAHRLADKIIGAQQGHVPALARKELHAKLTIRYSERAHTSINVRANACVYFPVLVIGQAQLPLCPLLQRQPC